MRRRLLPLLLLIASPAYAGFEGVTMCYHAAGGACTDTVIDQPTIDASASHAVGHLNKCVSTTLVPTSSYVLDAVSIELATITGCDGNITGYIYSSAAGDSEGAPDDLVATADSVKSCATITGAACATDRTILTFNFTGVTIPNNGAYQFVMCFDGSDVNYFLACGDGAITDAYGVYTRATLPPGAADDVANWTEADVNGGSRWKTYNCQ